MSDSFDEQGDNAPTPRRRRRKNRRPHEAAWEALEETARRHTETAAKLKADKTALEAAQRESIQDVLKPLEDALITQGSDSPEAFNRVLRSLEESLAQGGAATEAKRLAQTPR